LIIEQEDFSFLYNDTYAFQSTRFFICVYSLFCCSRTTTRSPQT
jgi:hypothetical protein